MNLEEIRSIQFSLLKKETDPDKKHKAEYIKKKSAKFVIPLGFPRQEEIFSTLVKDMFDDLMIDAPENVDSLGLWIEYDDITIDNAISLQTLDDIVMYAKEEINPAWEFFKMTIN